MSALSTFPLYLLLLSQQFYNENTPVPFRAEFNWPLFQVGLYCKVKPSKRTAITITDDMVLERGSRHRTLSFDDLTHIDDSRYLRDLDSRVYQAFPQSIDLIETYKHLTNRTFIGERPKTQKPEFYAVSKSICNPLQLEPIYYDVVVLVQSMVNNFDRRQQIRKFYREYEDQNLVEINGIRYAFVFSVGLPGTRSNTTFFRGSTAYDLSKRKYGGVTGRRGYKKTLRNLAKEIEKYDDILLGNYEDTFWNQTRKLHHSFAWVSLFCHKVRPMILLMSDDKLFSADSLASALNGIHPNQRDTLFKGEIVKHPIVFRHSIWYASKTEVPWAHYPDYPINKYTLFGFETVKKLTIGMYFTRYIPFADTYIGLVATRMHLNSKDLENLIEYQKLHVRNIM